MAEKSGLSFHCVAWSVILILKDVLPSSFRVKTESNIHLHTEWIAIKTKQMDTIPLFNTHWQG